MKLCFANLDNKLKHVGHSLSHFFKLEISADAGDTLSGVEDNNLYATDSVFDFHRLLEDGRK